MQEIRVSFWRNGYAHDPLRYRLRKRAGQWEAQGRNLPQWTTRVRTAGWREIAAPSYWFLTKGCGYWPPSTEEAKR